MTGAYAIDPAPRARPLPLTGSARPSARPRSTVRAMAATAATGKAPLAVEEARLARAAATGDGSAFAALYERYERRAYNLAYRITGSEPDAAEATQDAFLNVMRRLPQLTDRELAFGSYLFTATRNACYDLMRKRGRAEPSDAIPESATPVGGGGGAGAPDPGDPEEDPDRRQLLASQQEEIREASMRLPERQREALALRELEELSYDEIAETMEMNRNSVAQLISRARINLRDELRGTVLAAIAAASPECERALPLIAARDDGQLEADGEDEEWLDAHLAGCDRCRLGAEAMQEAGASYRAWAPLAGGLWLLRETMAEAAEALGFDWSKEISTAPATRPDPGSVPGMPAAYLKGRGKASVTLRRRAIVAAGLAALLLGGGVAAVIGSNGSSPGPARPAAGTRPAESAPASQPRSAPHRAKRDTPKKARGNEARGQSTTAASAAAVPSPAPQANAEGGGPAEPPASPPKQHGAAGPHSTQTTSTAKPKPKPEPAPQPPPVAQPTPAPTPPTQTQPPSDEPPGEEEPPPEEAPTRPPPAGVPPGVEPPR